MWDQMLGEGDLREAGIKTIAAGIPLGRMGTPEDVAYAALYLASDEAKYVTGIELNIDGGILAKFDADGEYLDEDMDFTFEDFKMPEAFKDLDGFLTN